MRLVAAATALCALLAFTSGAFAGSVAIPCPDLLGSYEADPYPPFGRTAPFLPGSRLSSLTTMKVHWTGTNSAGIAADSTTNEQSSWQARLVLTVVHPTAGVWTAVGAWSHDAFDETLQLVYFGYGSGMLNELLDGMASLLVDLRAPDLAPNTHAVSYPAGELTACKILADDTVPSEPWTWGAIKSLYGR